MLTVKRSVLPVNVAISPAKCLGVMMDWLKLGLIVAWIPWVCFDSVFAYLSWAWLSTGLLSAHALGTIFNCHWFFWTDLLVFG